MFAHLLLAFPFLFFFLSFQFESCFVSLRYMHGYYSFWLFQKPQAMS